jgi:hypothetical protein
MIWMNKHKRALRVALLILLMVAIAGPWAYDQINVPAEYPCTDPFVRLEGDFCGSPLSGIWMLSAVAGALASIVVGVVSGSMLIWDRAGEFSIVLLGLLFVMPIFSTLLLIIRGDSRRRLVFHIVALGVAVGLGLLLVSSYPAGPLWRLWGPWLYVGLTATALIVEATLLAARRRLA